jgi:hypothetical protein
MVRCFGKESAQVISELGIMWTEVVVAQFEHLGGAK